MLRGLQENPLSHLAASLIPGIDTFADAAAVPVDLLRGDYISAGLDAFGILPFVGEVADTVEKVNLPYKGYNSIEDLFWE